MSRKLSSEQFKQVRDWRMSGLTWEKCRLRLGDDGVVIQAEALAELCRSNAVIKVVRGQVRYEPWCAPNARRVQGQLKSRLSKNPPIAKSSSIASVPAKRTGLSVSGLGHPVEADQPVIPGDQVSTGHEVASVVDKSEKQIEPDQVRGTQPVKQVTQVQPVVEPASGVIAPDSVEATESLVVTSSTPSPVPLQLTQPTQTIPAPSSPQPVSLTKAERDAKRRALIAGASVAQAKLDAEELAKKRIAQEMADNEQKMDKIRKDIALEGVNRLALNTKPL